MNIDISKKDTKELKAIAFEIIAEQERLKFSLDLVVKEIHAREQKPAQEAHKQAVKINK